MYETDESDYERERYVPMPEVTRRPYLTYALLAINVVMFGLAELAGGTEDPDVLLDFGAMFGPLISQGEYWRLLTAMFLHSGFMHLGFNALALFIFGYLVERSYGHAPFFLIYFLAGLAGSVTSYLFNPTAVAAGASGAIFGVFGALAAFLLLQRRAFGKHAQNSLIGLAIFVAIQFFIGLATPGIDNWAHGGGLVAGFILGLALSPQYRQAGTRFGYRIFVNTSGSLILKWWIVPVTLLILALGVIIADRRLPENSYTHYFRAERYYSQGDYGRALDSLDLALESGPIGAAQSHLLRGKIYVETGNYQLARQELGIALRLGNRSVQVEALEAIRSIPGR